MTSALRTILLGGLLALNLVLAPPASAMSPREQEVVNQWASRLPGDWGRLDWQTIIRTHVRPPGGRPWDARDSGTPEGYEEDVAWLIDVLNSVEIPPHGDLQVAILTPPCWCSSSTTDIVLVWLERPVEHIELTDSVRSVSRDAQSVRMRVDFEVDGDANCCPSVYEERILEIKNGRSEWRSEFSPGFLDESNGCWQAASMLHRGEAERVDTSAVKKQASALQEALYQCNDRGEERGRVTSSNDGLDIRLDDGVLQFRWDAARQLWVTRWAPK